MLGFYFDLQKNHKILTDTINGIEGEIASQKVYSSLLLNKLREKYTKTKPATKTKNEESTDLGNNESKQASSGRAKDLDPKRLSAVQKELQNVAHPGEVQSAEADKQNHKGGGIKDPNYGEDHQGENFEPGGGGGAGLLSHVRPAPASPPHESVIAVLVFVCNRPTVKRNLDQLFRYRPSSEKFPVIVSQDCGSHPATTSVIKSYGDKLTHIMVGFMLKNVKICTSFFLNFDIFLYDNFQQPDLSDIKVPPKEKKLKGYYNIARHYGWALNYTFNTLSFDNVLIVEGTK